MVELYPGERLDYLVDESLQIIQSSEVFSFSIDAVLLARFAYVPIQKGNIIDLCTGNGVIPLLLSKRSKANIVGIEIQEKLFDMAKRSVEQNNAESQISIVHADINEIPSFVKGISYDVVTCNPPYFSANEKSEQNINAHFAIARHEIYCTLHDVLAVSSKLVKQKGKVAIVHRPERLADIMSEMRAYEVEPKRVQFVYPAKGKDANIVLVEGIKQGKPGIKILPPIIVYETNGTYTEQFNDLYNGRE